MQFKYNLEVNLPPSLCQFQTGLIDTMSILCMQGLSEGLKIWGGGTCLPCPPLAMGLVQIDGDLNLIFLMVLKFSVSKQEKACGKMAGENKCNHGRMNSISKKIFPKVYDQHCESRIIPRRQININFILIVDLLPSQGIKKHQYFELRQLTSSTQKRFFIGYF